MAKKIKFYQYAKCSTCVKAAQFLKKNKIDVESIDITENPPTIKELTQMMEAYEGRFQKLFNTSGLQYRELKIGEKIKTLTAKQAADLLAKNGRLVKRPFLIGETEHLVGFKEEDWEKALL